MDNNNTNTNTRKNKHLNIKERITIELRLKDGFSAYKIAKELNRSKNTILNEIKRGTTTQIKQGKPVVKRNKMLCTKTLYNYVDTVC